MTLPRGWARATIDDIADIKLGKMLDAAKNQGDLVPYLRNINVRWNAFDLSNLLEMRVTDEEFSSLKVRDGDVFVCEGGEPGRAAVWSGGPRNLVFQKALHRLRPEGGVEPDFIAQHLTHEVHNDRLSPLLTGTTIKHLPQIALRKMAVDLPPVGEQRRIVAKLDALTARLACARAGLDRSLVSAKRLRRIALSSAFQPNPIAATTSNLADERIHHRNRSLYALPVGWMWRAVGSIGVVSGGLTKNAGRLSETKVPYLRVANVYANQLRLLDVAEISCSLAEVQKTKLAQGDILIVEGNGSLDQVGRAAIWNEELPDCCHQNHLIRFRANKGILPKFLLYWLVSPAGRAQLEQLAASSSGLHTLSITKIAGVAIPIPDLKTQTYVVEQLETTLAHADRLEAEAARARALLDRLEAALLARAFRGELVPQDPNDEPASVLLDRIRAERAAAPKPKRGRRAKPVEA